MANRAKRIALFSKNEETTRLIKQLYKESELRESDRKYFRDLERENNKRYLRLTRRGLPDWVIKESGSLDLISKVMEYRSQWRHTFKQFPWGEEIPLGELKKALPEFLFVRYPIPEFLRSAFIENDALAMQIYIHLGSGKNLRTMPGLPFPLTKRMAHFFTQSPDFHSVYKSLRFGQVLGYGGSEELAKSIIASRMDYDPARAGFWAEVIQWLIHHQVRHDDYVKLIIAYIHERKFRRRNLIAQEAGTDLQTIAIDPDFSIKGRKFDKLLSDAIDWNWLSVQMGDQRNNKIVKEVNDLRYFTGGGKQPRYRYEIRPLLTVEEIREEGRRMHHCVGTYADEASSGQTSIWSLTETAVRSEYTRRLLTIEVVEGRVIAEVRGNMNRLATNFERSLIHRWASQEGLTWAEDELRW